MDIFSYSFHDASILSLRHEGGDLRIKMCTFQFKENDWKRVDLDIHFFNVQQVYSWVNKNSCGEDIWRLLPSGFTIDEIDNIESDWLSDTEEEGVYTFERSFRIFCDHADVVSITDF